MNFFAKLILLISMLLSSCNAAYGDGPSKEYVLATIKTSSRFMMEKVSYQGGFVWAYLPDFSRQWGELEARRSMIELREHGEGGGRKDSTMRMLSFLPPGLH